MDDSPRNMDSQSKASGKRAPFSKRFLVLAIIIFLHLSKSLFATTDFPCFKNANGICDVGQLVVPPLVHFVSQNTAEYVWWLGSMFEELVIIGTVIFILVVGRGIRAGINYFVVLWLHFLLWHATVLPNPDGQIWRFPEFGLSLSTRFDHDFWFSGHTALAILMALAVGKKSPLWLKIVAWSHVAFIILLVLTTRAHYSIDILGAFFVAYTIDRISKDAEKYFQARTVHVPYLS